MVAASTAVLVHDDSIPLLEHSRAPDRELKACAFNAMFDLLSKFTMWLLCDTE